jgi:hypothetical protein
MEPANMSDKHPDANAVVSGGVHGQQHSVNDEYMPKSVWRPGVVRRLADYIQQLREVDDESNKRPLARQPRQSAQSEQPSQPHVCTRSPHRTCNCDAGVCADDDATYRYARGPFVATDPSQRIAAPKPNELGNFRCPITGQLCSANVCRDWCESGVDYSKT